MNILVGATTGIFIATILTTLVYGNLQFNYVILLALIGGIIWYFLTPAFQHLREKNQLYPLALAAIAGLSLGGVLCLFIPKILIGEAETILPEADIILPRAYLVVVTSAYFSGIFQFMSEVEFRDI
jgi:zinc transporter ZupT